MMDDGTSPRRGSLKERLTAYEAAAASPRSPALPSPGATSASTSPLKLQPEPPKSEPAEPTQPAPINKRISSVLSLGEFPDDPPTPESVAGPNMGRSSCNMGRSPRTSITLGQCVSSGGELGVTPGAEVIGPVITMALSHANTLLADRCSVPRIATVLAQAGIYDSDTLRMVLASSTEEQKLGALLASKADAPLALVPVLKSQLLGTAPAPEVAARRSSVRASNARASSVRASSVRASSVRASTVRSSKRNSSKRISATKASEEEAPETNVAIEVIALLLRCRFREVMPLLRSSMGHQIDAIATFFEDATVFVLSRLWFDTIFGYILGLHAVSYCGHYLAMECVAESPSELQFKYAAVALVVTAFLKNLVEYTGLTDPVVPAEIDEAGNVLKPRSGGYPGFHQVPMMLKYVVGWAFAFAIEAKLVEIKTATPSLCASDGTDCLTFDLQVAGAFTALSGLVLLFVKPLADEIEWLDEEGTFRGKVVDFLEDLFEDFWAMVDRVLSVCAMVLWYDTSYRWMTYGNASSDGRLEKLVVLWALSSTYLGSYITICLEQLEKVVRTRADDKARLAKEKAEQPLTTQRMSNGDLLVGVAHAKAAAAQASRAEAMAKCVISYSNLLQASLAWVAGCAWNDVVTTVFASLNADPSPVVVVQNFGVSLLIACLAVAWFVGTGAPPTTDETDRSQVEHAFMQTAFAFFTGWVLLVSHRNLVALFEKLLETGTVVADEALDLASGPEGAANRSENTYIGDYIGVVLYVIAATFALFRIQFWASHAIAKATDTEVTDREHRFDKGDEKEEEEVEDPEGGAPADAAHSTRMNDTVQPARTISKGGEKEML